METIDNKFYYKPVPDDRTIEKATIRASYLVDNGYVKLSSGLTYDQLLQHLIKVELKNKIHLDNN